MTVLDIITEALNISGVYGTGESPSATDAQVTLNLLQGMIDGWNSQRINLFSVLFYQPTLIPSQQSYNIGPSGSDFNTSFSITQIQSASCVIPGTTGRKDISLIDSTKWAAIGEKGIVGVFPNLLWCNYSFPIATLNFSPIPSQSITIDLYLWSILQQFTSYTQEVLMRPGYAEAIVYNLAVKTYAPFGIQIDSSVVQLAATYKQQMQSLNASSGLTSALSSSTTLNIPNEGVPQLPGSQGPQGQ